MQDNSAYIRSLIQISLAVKTRFKIDGLGQVNGQIDSFATDCQRKDLICLIHATGSPTDQSEKHSASKNLDVI